MSAKSDRPRVAPAPRERRRAKNQRRSV